MYQSRFDEATILIDRMARIYTVSLGPEHPDTVDATVAQADILTQQGESNRSLPIYWQALKLQENRLDSNHPVIGNTLNNLGVAYLKNKDFPASIAPLRKSLKIKETTLPFDHPDFGITLNNLIAAHIGINDDDAAEPLLRQLILIKEKKFSRKTVNFGNTACSLADLYTRKGLWTQAETYYRQAVDSVEATTPHDRNQLARYLNNYGFFLQKKSDHYGAIPLFQRALDLNEELLGAQHPTLAINLLNLGNSCNELKRYVLAEKLFEWALTIRELQFGSEHLTTAMARFCLAMTLSRQKRYAEAEPLMRNVVVTFEKINGLLNEDSASVYENFGLLLKAMGRTEESQEMLYLARRIRETLAEDRPN